MTKEEQKTKRAKLSAPDAVPVVLHTDALQVVMDYLAPRELFRLAFSSKELMNSVTTKTIVRSALLHGSRPKRTVEVLAPLMKNYSIDAPSPLRLLRLVNGDYCEHPDCVNRCYHVKKSGNFYCSDCQNDFPKPLLQDQPLSEAPSPEKYLDFIQAFDEFHARSIVLVEEKKRKVEEARQKAAANKRAQLFAWIKELKARLPAEWRGLALRYESDWQALRYESDWQRTIKFKVDVVNDILHEYVANPKKMTNRLLEETSQQIITVFEALQNFLKFDFLDEKKHFDSKVKPFYVRTYPDLRTLLNSNVDVSRVFLRKLQVSGDKFEALVTLYEAYHGIMILVFPSRKEFLERFERKKLSC